MLRAVFALLFALTWIGIGEAQAQRRVALVIGAAEYRELPGIVRSAGDARAVKEALETLGFVADLVLDPDGRALDDAVDRFTGALQRGDIALIYFSGHAARVRGEFVVLPVDAPPVGNQPDDPRRRYGIALSALADEAKAAGARAQILVVDACRGDPYAGAGPDLAPAACGEVSQPLPDGTLALFSASIGQTALDRVSANDRDPHSLFTRVLLRQLPEVRSAVRLARVVRDEVVDLAAEAGHEQRPATVDELVGSPVLLAPREEAVASLPERAPRLPEPPPPEPTRPRPAQVLACGALAPGPPAFNCRAARRLVEETICRDPRLGSCDRVLNTLFERAQAGVGRGAANLRREEDAWVARRNACAEAAPQGAEALVACIGRAYEERIGHLERLGDQPPAPVLARPSFDCRNARTRVENAICADPVLAAKDRRMARLYEQASAFSPGAIEGSQDAWRADRDACARARAVEACVEEAYDARIRELRSLRASR